MNYRSKWVVFVMLICMLISFPITVSATVETTEAPESSEVSVALSTSKDSYSQNEEIDVTLFIGNNSGISLTNVTGRIILPTSFEIIEGTECQQWDELPAAKLVQNTITICGSTSTNYNLDSSSNGLGDQTLETSKTISVDGQEIELSATISFSFSEISETITRRDMEAAVSEILWDYYFKDTWMQYDSSSFNELVNYSFGGFSRLDTHMSTLEDSNSDDTLYSVCSNYPWTAYYEALGYPMHGYCLNASSLNVWFYAQTSQANGNVDDMCIARWHNHAGGYTTVAHDGVHGGYYEDKEENYLSHEKCFDTYQEMRDFISNWEDNLRPSDIIYLPGHIVTYAGNGWILESGGLKYDLTHGFDQIESDGTINAMTVEDYFFPDSPYGGSGYRLDKYIQGSYDIALDDPKVARVAIVRPLNLLTIDDGDDDLSNDILNTEYVQNGVDRLRWQFDFDTVELAHSGYTIQYSAYTRLKYPGMNIDRTVNITPYGTAVKGEVLTYTVSIANKSNHSKYTEFHSTGVTDYEGEDYIGLCVAETIPQNTVLISAPEATIVNNTLYWEIDIPKGTEKSISYTVKVTGDIGDEVVNGDGWVEMIPSNTITNTIGGQKLDNNSIQAMETFYRAGKEAWNSNSGYKISASLTNTEFAERIYQSVIGLNLELPDLQELMDMLFTQEYIEVEKGMYGQYNKTAKGWLYTLNDTTPVVGDQIYRDMLINGYYGGAWVWSNSFNQMVRRLDDPRIDYLEVGDIIINWNLTNSSGEVAEKRTVKEWQVVVYLGDNYFASLDSNGVMLCCGGTRNILPSLNSDMFVALRPSQAYENLNVNLPEFSGTINELTTDDSAWKHVSVGSEILLNDELCAKIASLTPADIAGANTNYGPAMVGVVYDKLNIDVVTNGTHDLDYLAIMHMLFNDIPSDSSAYARFWHENHLLDEPVYGYEALYDMLLYYDGQAFADVNEDGTRNRPLPAMSNLHIGDVILLGLREERHFVTMVYQGNGRFLTGTYSLMTGLYYMYYAETLDFVDDNALMNYLNGHILTKDRTGETDFYWEGYLVFRPSRAYTNINEMIIPEPRDIMTGKLTDTEKERLANIQAEEWPNTNANSNLSGFPAWAYEQAYVLVGEYFDKSLSAMGGALFDSSNEYQLSEVTEANARYHQMLIPESYGGIWLTHYNYLLPQDSFQIGDLYCIRFDDGGNVYWVALYQGNGNFLVQENGYGTRAIFTKTYEELCSKAGDVSCQTYFVLRPENMIEEPNEEEPEPRDIMTGKLTDTEKERLANIQAEEWPNTNANSNLSGFPAWAYEQAYVLVDEYFDKSLSAMGGALFDSSNEYQLSEVTEATARYHQMLIPESYGGTWLTHYNYLLPQDSFQIGDLYCIRFDDGGNVYWVALYQGNGNFLVQENGYGTRAIFTKTYEELCSKAGDVSCQTYFVLRVDNLPTE